MARAKVPRATFDYTAGGAEEGAPLRRSREASGRWALRPRVLGDVSRRDTKTVLVGERVSMPVCVAPTSFHALVHPEGEVATARGAAAAETILIASTTSTKPLEEVAAAADAPQWFQLYVYRDRAVTEELVARAVKAGYKALCLTADTPVLGRRERDERNAFTLPLGFGIANLKGVGLDGMPEVEHGSAFAKYVTDLLDSSLTWDDVDWLKSISPLPLVIKGIMTAEDAVLAADHGAAGIVVSNHGGRQLDSPRDPESPSRIRPPPRCPWASGEDVRGRAVQESAPSNGGCRRVDSRVRRHFVQLLRAPSAESRSPVSRRRALRSPCPSPRS